MARGSEARLRIGPVLNVEHAFGAYCGQAPHHLVSPWIEAQNVSGRLRRAKRALGYGLIAGCYDGGCFSSASTASNSACLPNDTSWILPLTKNAGVPRTPLSRPLFWCSRMRCR